MAELQTVSSWRTRPSAQDGLFLAAGLASWIFLLVLPVRLRQLHLASVKVNTSRLAFYKIAASFLLIAACFSSAFILARRDTSDSFAAQWSLYGGPAASVAVAILSFQEHRRNLRPSNTIVLYLVATLIIDLMSLAVPLRFGWPTTFYGAKTFEATAKGTLLFLESRSKQRILREEFHDLPPEELAGVLSLTYFWWLHDLLQLGYDKVLSPADLPRMDSKLESDPLRQKILAAWETRETPDKPTTLPRVLFSCFSVPITLVAIPRLFLILFQFSQPILISRAISFVQGLAQEQSIDDNASAAGSWIVVAAGFVYFGLMTSTVVYRHLLDRIQVMLKGALVGIIHQKSLTGRSHAYDDGKALTLISTDVVEIEGAAEMFHELWAFCLEAAVGFSMLAMEIGWLWPLPAGIVFVFSQTSRYAVKPMKARQTAWNEATQKRLSMTSSILGAIKSVKILGMQTAVEDVILQLRENELLAAKGVRWVNVLYNSSANALGLFSPVLTVALYAILASAHGKEFDTRTAFTTTAILSMITHPINMVMTILPRIAASMSSFERIQTYLLRPSVDDKRVSTEHEDIARTSDAVVFTDVTIPDQQSSKPILQSVNFSIAKGSLAIVAGPVGAGKTLLMHSILGETIFSKGTVAVSSLKMAFCSQTAWLPNRTIRECILGLDGGVHIDQTRYDKVLDACCLLEDFGALPDGDQTVVGTGGQNLSGGQRQRVAIARAVYSKLDMFIFDDSFSALDSKTQSAVINNLLGPNGLLRNSSMAVIWVTNNQSYFHLSDKVILLADGTVKYQGDLQDSDKAVLGQMFTDTTLASTNSDEYTENDTIQADASQPQKASPKGPAAAIDYQQKDGDRSLYKYYILSAGIGNVSLVVLLTATLGFFLTMPALYLKWWTESKPSNTVLYASGYVSMLVVAWMATTLLKWADIILVAGRSGETLHRRLLRSICNAPLFFFSNTDLGTVLNRFTQDIQLVDKRISVAMSSFLAQCFKLLMQVIVLVISQPLLGVTLPICVAIVYVVQKRYLRTSRQLRRIELESQSAVYFNILETVSGVQTIRAFGWQDAMAQENAVSLDNSQRPVYLTLSLQRWLNVVLDAVVACIAVGTVWLAVWGALAGGSPSQPIIRLSPSGGQIGVALNIILVTNTTLLRLIQTWTTLEVSLGAVARLREATHETPQEESLLDKDAIEANGDAGGRLPANWPSTGKIELANVTASYSQDTPVLNGVNLSINPGQVAVICGRTGSGKSSLLMSLLRLLTVHTTGSITIDGINLAGLQLDDIRERAFVTVSQDPFLLPGASLRFHLDPTETLPDRTLAEALQKTGLLSLFVGSSYDEHGGDDVDGATASLWDRALSSFPVLSAGQAQLLSLARALLQLQTRSSVSSEMYSDREHGKRMPIVLLDEITASLDAETEAAVYDVVEEVFIKGQQGAGHTVLIVTHRPAALTRRLRPGQDVTVWMSSGKVERVEPVEV
ncbi:hypothetical protein HMPREF1624_05816 [Sporothrix schenckii ATCC 58251]|uniref:ABC transporter n=1 Tax=Sporothrix schenckii (strain ATCC 58251 / de Perez 2211183) TaxID=1391915 RepID=U7PT50_SPOS1|nr:hypothetical protein HMPREF1624_05816 [Sporothrix schenckii ATCC 58251]